MTGFVLRQGAFHGRSLDAMHGAMVARPALRADLPQELTQGDGA